MRALVFAILILCVYSLPKSKGPKHGPKGRVFEGDEAQENAVNVDKGDTSIEGVKINVYEEKNMFGNENNLKKLDECKHSKKRLKLESRLSIHIRYTIHTSTTIRVFAAVILGMEVCPKLEAVVGPAHQIPPAARVTVMLAPVTRPVTVTLSNVTRIVRGAATPAVIVSSTALFTWDKI